ncbi:MAG: hypothetical protein AABY40_03560 [Nanoarchaeota archaeon]
MWQQKILYRGNASETVKPHNFQLLMEGKGVRIAYLDSKVCKEDLYIIEPATTLKYTARRRMVPCGLDLWHITVTLSGYHIYEVEKSLETLVFEQKP